jgi:hypothetical protein
VIERFVEASVRHDAKLREMMKIFSRGRFYDYYHRSNHPDIDQQALTQQVCPR